MITVSLVSHGHGGMVGALLADLSGCPEVAQIVLTQNIPESMPGVPAALAGRVSVRRNPSPRGFAANHNAAFRDCQTPFFCVLNPDIRLLDNPFPALLSGLDHMPGLCAPAVLGPTGQVEDNARRFPGILGLTAKLLGISDGRYDYAVGDAAFQADWVAGMFMLFSADAFSALRGFDEGFYLYYEDVDICARMWGAGYQVTVCPQAVVLHAAQRASRRNLRHLAWHLDSMRRYFAKHGGRLPPIGPTKGRR